MKHDALLNEVLAALREGRPARVLGPRRPAKLSIPPTGTARSPLDLKGPLDSDRAGTFASEKLGPEPSLEDCALWEVEYARRPRLPWATWANGEIVYFDTEPEAAAYADEVARKEGYILVDNLEQAP